jgi:tetratricopeptide (TPR) repeat protein
LPQAKIEVLCELGTALAQAQQLRQARALWAQAEALIRAINDESGYYKDIGRHYLGISLAWAQQWERAEAVAQSVQTWYSYANPHILYELSIALARAQQWERAEAVAQTIQWSYTKFDTLCELGTLLAKNQQLIYAHAIFSQAEEIARAMEISRDKTRVLCDLGVALAQTQQWEHAKAVLTEAERVARVIRKDRNSVLALCDLGVALSKAQQWERAEAVAQTISDVDCSVEVLREVRTQLVASDGHEQLLRLVQRAWRQAQTREYAIELLSLAIGLVSLKPEIGTDFCEAFAWVDTVLN